MPVIHWINEIFNSFTTRVYNMALRNLEFVPDHFKTQEMCSKAVCMDPYSLEFVPDHLKTQEMCDKAVCTGPYNLKSVPDHLKTKDMCDETVGRSTHTRWSMCPIT